MGPRSGGLWLGAVCVAGLTASAPGQTGARWLRVEGVGTPEVRPGLVEGEAGGEVRPVEGWLEDAVWVYGLNDFEGHNYSAVVLPAGIGQGDGGVEVFDVVRPADLVLPGRVAMFGVQMEDRIVEMTAAEFGVLAERAGVEWTPAEGERRVMVRRIEGAKVLLRTAGSLGGEAEDAGAMPVPSEVPSTKRGERAEIRALMDPTTCTGGQAGGGVLPVRVYTEGASVEGAVVIATHVGTGEEQRSVARQFGIADLQIDREGAWRVEFTVLYPVPRDQEATWVAYTGTLSFETAWSGGGAGAEGAPGAGGGR